MEPYYLRAKGTVCAKFGDRAVTDYDNLIDFGEIVDVVSDENTGLAQ